MSPEGKKRGWTLVNIPDELISRVDRIVGENKHPFGKWQSRSDFVVAAVRDLVEKMEEKERKYEIEAVKIRTVFESEDRQKQEHQGGFVKGSDFDNWHWCKNCTQYPLYVKKGRFDRPRSKLCPQCKALEDNNNCNTERPRGLAVKKTT